MRSDCGKKSAGKAISDIFEVENNLYFKVGEVGKARFWKTARVAANLKSLGYTKLSSEAILDTFLARILLLEVLRTSSLG